MQSGRNSTEGKLHIVPVSMPRNLQKSCLLWVNQCPQSFGTGVGRVLLRGMAGVLGDGERVAVAADAGGTRQGVALQRIAANLLDNYSHYALGLHARISRRKAGHGGASQASLQELGRRLLSIDFVVFALAFRDMMERQSVFTRSVQAQGEPPWLTAVSFRHKQQQCREDLQLLLRVATLVRHICVAAALLRRHRATGLEQEFAVHPHGQEVLPHAPGTSSLSLSIGCMIVCSCKY